MNIVSTQFTLSTNSLEVFVSGCNPPHCEGCSNPEIWEFGKENNYLEKLEEIKNKIKEFDNLINNIILVGGCPLDQSHTELIDFLKKLNTLDKEIFLFTKYDLGDVPYHIRRQCSYIKCGRYIPSLSVDNNTMYGIKLATSNQIIYKRGKDY
jgi:anaerobic ribonucleoside-triphosphate reductase activating protein